MHTEYDEKRFEVTSTNDATVLGVESLRKSTLRLKASGREFDFVVEKILFMCVGPKVLKTCFKFQTATMGSRCIYLATGSFAMKIR